MRGALQQLTVQYRSEDSPERPILDVLAQMPTD
jgi:hypothetical protein